MRRILSIRVLLPAVTGLMTLVLVGNFAMYAVHAVERREDVRRIPPIVDVSYDLFAAIQDLRLERGAVNRALAAPEIADGDVQSEIARLRAQSGKSLDSALTKLSALKTDGVRPEIEEISRSREAFVDMRPDADLTLQQPKDKRSETLLTMWLAANGRLVRAIDNLSSRLESELSRGDSFVAQMIRVKQLVWPVRSDSGNDRLLVLGAMTSGNQLSDSQRHELDVLAGRIEGVWALLQDEARRPTTPARLKDAINAADKVYFTEFRALRNHVVSELSVGRRVEIDMRDWTNLSAAGRLVIYEVAKTAYDLASTHADQQLAEANQDLSAALALMLLFLGVGALTSLYVIKGVVQPITEIAETMRVVAGGDLSGDIAYEDRSDEIGLLSRSLRVFRDNAIEKQQLFLAKVGAEASNRTKSEFLANMSHELRTPLNAIIGYSEIIKIAMFGPISERYRGAGSDIFDSGTHLLNLINEILDLSKLEAGQFELYEENFDLAPAIDACLHLIEPQASKAKVRLSKAIDDDLPLIRGDDRRIRQIVINLLSNAVKFTPEGGTVGLAASLTNGRVTIAVSDTGIGMASDQIPKALQPFRQIDSRISRKHEGTGLGLPLAKHLVELHGGELIIESRVNFGTTVKVVLPAKRSIARPALPVPVTATA